MGITVTLMRVCIILILVSGSLFSASPPPSVGPAAGDSDLNLAADLHPEQIVSVIVRKADNSEQAQLLVEKLGGQVTKALPMINAFAAEMPAGAARQLAGSPEVSSVSFDALVESTSVHTTKFYLHNNFPPVPDHVASRAILPLHNAPPTFPTLPNYSTDRNNNPGLVVRKGGDTDPTNRSKVQHWRMEGDPTGMDISGAVQLVLYAAMKDFNVSKKGMLQAFLVDWNSEGLPSPIATAGVMNDSWDGDWQAVTLNFGTIFYNLPAGHQLGLSLFVNSTSDDDMWFAYGSSRQPSALIVSSGAADPGSLIVENTFLETLSVPQAWELGYTGQGVTVAVIDSGVADGADFAGSDDSRIIYQQAFNDSLTLSDQNGHGTHVAGIIGGNGANRAGLYAGVAPGVNLISLNVINSRGLAYESDTLLAMQWVLENHEDYNIRVVNLSINSTVLQSYHTSPLSAAAEILWFNGIVVVVAAGNNGIGTGTGNLYPPANDPFVITVGASDEKLTGHPGDDEMAVFSAYGTTMDGFSKPDIVAPGRNIISVLAPGSFWSSRYPTRVLNGGDYFRVSGTSMAAPMVSGAAALLLEKEPDLTPDQVKYRLMQAANTIYTENSSYPYLNVVAALTTETSQPANSDLEASQLLFTGDDPINWGSVNWNSVNWNSVNWNSVNWNSVNWNSVNWNSVNWNSVNWNSVNWNSVSWID
jgi:serine protease AprX